MSDGFLEHNITYSWRLPATLENQLDKIMSPIVKFVTIVGGSTGAGTHVYSNVIIVCT